MNPVTILQSKSKLFSYFLLSLAFVAGGIWVWGVADDYTGFKHWKALIGAVICVPFFGLGVVVFGFKLFDTRPGLILNDQGIHRLGVFGFQPVIRWEHITHCSVTQVKRTTILLIHVDNAEEVLTHLSPIARWSQRLALDQFGTPFSVSSNNLRINIEELKELIENGVAAHRARI